MANRKYALGTQAFIQGDIDMPSAGLWLILASSSYTPDTGTTGDEFANDVTGQVGAQALDSVAVSPQANGRVRLTASSEAFATISGTAAYVVLATNQGAADASRRLLYLWDTDDDLPYADASGTVSFPSGFVVEYG